MQWSLVPTAGSKSYERACVFDDHFLMQVFEMSEQLPWLQALDPYRDALISPADISLVRREFTILRLAHTLTFLTVYTQERKLRVEAIRAQPYLLQAVSDALGNDPLFQLLERALRLLDDASRSGTSIQILGS